ncbi:hypothetical protein BRD00_09605 [Halobacteriales archaeon QS_8_69_26]|nr:MAG: hypothetical protein BRD00_09605 [Halobacteriales archaeon QS_8_69_26]
MTRETVRADLAVAGAGMAGLVAGVRAAERGLDPVLLEKAPEVGGSMRLSAGLVWSYPTVEEAREAAPDGDPALQRLVVEGLDDGFEWLRSLGLAVDEPPVELPTGDVVTTPTPGANCGKVDPGALCATATDRIRDDGGRILTETPMTGLRTDDAGRVVGVDAAGPDGPLAVEADAVLLATGGFQGDEELLQSFVTPCAETLWLRSNPHSTGDGLRAARDAGATTTAGMDTFYGHNLAAPPAGFGPDEYLEATQYYGPFAVAVDRHGERFTDESESDLEHTLAQDTLHEAGGRAHYLLDGDLYRDEVFSMGRVGDIVDRAAEMGGQVIRARSLDDLGQRLWDAGVDGDRAVETVREYNEAVRAGRGDRLDPPRRDHARPLDRPPFYAVAVQPGITFTMGGIRVDDEMRVLRRAETGSTLAADLAGVDPRRTPIPGLYAAGVDVGGINHRGYLGGLATALVTGYEAVETAVADGVGG